MTSLSFSLDLIEVENVLRDGPPSAGLELKTKKLGVNLKFRKIYNRNPTLLNC